MEIEQVEELYEFLQGKHKEIGKLHFERVPKLSSRQAFSVIYFLQEHMHLIPDKYERCCTCKELFDADREGKYPHCDYCCKD